jgi:amino acid transporter
MRKRFLRTLHSASTIWTFLTIGIILTSVVYATLSVLGVSSDISLLVAFISFIELLLVGLSISSLPFLLLREKFHVKDFFRNRNLKRMPSTMLAITFFILGTLPLALLAIAIINTDLLVSVLRVLDIIIGLALTIAHNTPLVVVGSVGILLAITGYLVGYLVSLLLNAEVSSSQKQKEKTHHQ